MANPPDLRQHSSQPQPSSSVVAAHSHHFCLCSNSVLVAVAVLTVSVMVFLLGKRRSSQSARTKQPKGEETLSLEGIELEARNANKICFDSPGVFKSALLNDTKESVVGSYFPDVRTLFDAFQRGLKIAEHSPCLGCRPTKNAPYQFLSYAEVAKRSQSFGQALITKLGIRPGNDSFVAIYAQNCPQWMIAVIGCVRHSIVVVPLYDTLGADAATYVLNHTGAELVLVDDLNKLANVLKECPSTLKHVVLIGTSMREKEVQEASEKTKEVGVELHSFEDLMESSGSPQEGGDHLPPVVEDHPPKPNDTYIVCYTSGTTGTPKGVLLSHANVLANLAALSLLLERFMPELLEPHGSIISYLPLSHMFEQVAHWISLSFGFRIGYFSGDIGTLSDDMQCLKPTLFPVVPRLLNRFNDTLKSLVAHSSPFKRWLFQLAYSQKLALLRKGVVTNRSIWDKLVFSKAQQQLGGNVRLIVTGSAPIAPEVLQDLRIAFGTQIIEGYGQTECTAMVTVTWPDDMEGGHCGAPAACSLVKLADVPELNYFSSDRKGEVLVKGPSVTKGYYRDPEKTAELFDEDGWLHTGDIAQILPDGRLKIIDRKKHIFKLAQGEYVAPEKIESVYVQCPLVHQIYVDGDSLERNLVAIVVPPENGLKRLYAELRGTPENGDLEKQFEEICADKKVVEAVLKQMQQMGKERKLNAIEQVRAVFLEPEQFTVENGLLTPTFKSKRPQLRQKYREQVAALYRTGEK
uniref:Long-chain-fatty-acid--CoA ligase n=1 Tax=Globodera pallida TaxID=36090 RepID=A0A183BHG0_GLOPA